MAEFTKAEQKLINKAKNLSDSKIKFTQRISKLNIFFSLILFAIALMSFINGEQPKAMQTLVLGALLFGLGMNGIQYLRANIVIKKLAE